MQLINFDNSYSSFHLFFPLMEVNCECGGINSLTLFSLAVGILIALALGQLNKIRSSFVLEKNIYFILLGMNFDEDILPYSLLL